MDSKVHNLKFVHSPPSQFNENTLYVQKFAEDTVGTTFGASWVYVFSEKHEKKVALYKPIDYDEPLGAYAELFYSHIAKLCFRNIKIRIPEINIFIENDNLGILSYSIVNSVVEDLIHIDSLLFYKYERKDLKTFFTLGVNDIFECIGHEVCNEENFIEIQKSVIFTILLDAFTNNVDRHGKNWGLVRNKVSDYYELAIFDNVKSFINMFSNRTGYKDKDLWVIEYNGIISSPKLETGNEVCKFIKEAYPDYFNEFILSLKSAEKIFASDIISVDKINTSRVVAQLKKKINHFESTNEEEV